MGGWEGLPPQLEREGAVVGELPLMGNGEGGKELRGAGRWTDIVGSDGGPWEGGVFEATMSLMSWF